MVLSLSMNVLRGNEWKHGFVGFKDALSGAPTAPPSVEQNIHY